MARVPNMRTIPGAEDPEIQDLRSKVPKIYAVDLARRFINLINERISEERKKFNTKVAYSKRQLARDAGMSTSPTNNMQIYMYFSGRRKMSMEMLDRLLLASGVSILDLISERELGAYYSSLDKLHQMRVRISRDRLKKDPTIFKRKLPHPSEIPDPPKKDRPVPVPLRPPVKSRT